MESKKNLNLMSKKIFIKTFGCQMNEYDSNRIFESVSKIGYEKTEIFDEANCYILNTCHIRDKAKEKVYHEIGRVKKNFKLKEKPVVIVAGCVAQAENNEMIKREPYIDIVIGPQSYHKINDSILNHIKKKEKEEQTDFDTILKFDYFDKIRNNNSKVSSFLTIQEGCDKFCKFCVVPYTRGPEYSRSFYKIIDEAKQLIKNGSKEITVLGQNVNAYLYEEKNKNFRLSDIIMALEEFSELKRIRYTTSHPIDMTDDLVECYSKSRKLVPFIHLPIQSGSNRILKLMNRNHTVEYYLSVYEKLKKINPKIEFSSDFIIAYPGETEKDFEDTMKLVKKIKFINSYSFIFSPRPGTAAFNLKLIDKNIAKERLKLIQDQLFSHQSFKNKMTENTLVKVLVENKISNQNKFFGRTEHMTAVIFDGEKNIEGKIVPVLINHSNQNNLFGEVKLNKNIKAA
jgi:tRNA-2-methylthio-N6-dimethylallyladenosine synthase